MSKYFYTLAIVLCMISSAAYAGADKRSTLINAKHNATYKDNGYQRKFADRNQYFCWQEADYRDQIARTDVIFTGKLIAIEDMGINYDELGTSRKKLTFKVEEAWKGLEGNTREVIMDTESFYRYQFAGDTLYLIHGFRIYDDRISVIGCPRVKKAQLAEREIGLLGFPEYSYRPLGGEIAVKVRF